MSRKRLAGRRPPKVVAAKVRDIVSRTCGLQITSDSQKLADDLYLGDVEKVELLVSVEVGFGIDFTKGEANSIATVQDLIIAVAAKSSSVKPIM